MSKLLLSSVAALALVAGASSAMSQEYEEPVPIDEYGDYPDDQEGSRQFWRQFEDGN